MNVFRIFEATNDFRNIESATKAVKDLGGATVCVLPGSWTCSR